MLLTFLTVYRLYKAQKVLSVFPDGLIHGELRNFYFYLQWHNVRNRSERDDLRGVDLGHG